MGKKIILAIVGPTASGKSALALSLAEDIGGEIIAVDSMQVYRGLDIGTAKPKAEERLRVAHHLIDVVEPQEEFNAALYRRQARAAVEDILARHKIPVLCGGTGLYLRALLDGIFEGPGTQDDFRREFYQDWETGRGPQLYARLQALDPEAAARIRPQDKSRIVRALEVHEAAGLTITELQQNKEPLPYTCYIFALERGRDDLYLRINQRVESMMEQGFLEEVKKLLAAGLSPQLKSLQSLGYKHMIKYIKGEWTREEALNCQKRDTRRYAKRQLTWFRRDSRIQWLLCSPQESGQEKIKEIKNLLAKEGNLL